jgi:hypothetical protein
MRRRGRAAVLLAAGLLLCLFGLSGCDTQDADATIGAIDFYDALLAGDGHAACAHMAPAARADVSLALHRPCADAILAIAPPKAFLRGLKINNGSVTGDDAIVDVIPFDTNVAAELKAQLAYVGGAWRITEPLVGLEPVRKAHR